MAFRNSELPQLWALVALGIIAWSAGKSHSLAPSCFLPSLISLLQLVVMGTFKKWVTLLDGRHPVDIFSSPNVATTRLRDPRVPASYTVWPQGLRGAFSCC